MKIAMLTDTYTPQINGVVTSIRSSVEELTLLGHEVFIFAPDFGGKEQSEGNVFRFPSTGFPFKAIKEFQVSRGYGSIIQKLKELKIDLIHSHVPGSMGLKAIPISRYLKIPHVHTYHTFWPDYVHYVPLGSRYTKLTAEHYSALFCNRCDAIIAPTQKIQDALRLYGTRTPISVVPTGIKTAEFSQQTNKDLHERFHIPMDRKILVYAGRIAKEKNVFFLLDVMEEIIHKMNNKRYHLLLLGDGAARKSLEKRAAETGLSSYISYSGFLAHEDVMEIFHQSDLFVFASRTETQGLVLLEAMASGIPAVVVEALGIGDIMKDGKGGISVPEDSKIFSLAVIEIMEDEKLYNKKKGEVARKAKEYSISNCTKRMEDLYERTLEKFKPHSSVHLLSSTIRRRTYRSQKHDLPIFEETLQNYLAEPKNLQNRYFVMRHGKSEANEKGIIISHYSNGLKYYGLTEEGKEQIRESFSKQSLLDSSTIIISSDFLRARESATIAAAELKTKPPRTTMLLRERYFGRYEEREDLYYKMVWQLDEKDDNNSEFGVESPDAVQERVRMLIRQLEEEYQNEQILLVSHGDTLQITQTWTEGVPAGLHRSLKHLETGEIRELVLKKLED
ncbi:MAG: hypothetical protein B6241_01875 [Spirochaetaceae bacterium 4572_59]|nr:MAG: hypothetical protein B6241_01875 [Spirochaetaceae bacterium 4572_59]